MTENLARPYRHDPHANSNRQTPQEAQYTLVNPTILYMPHCDRILYENILRENWSGDGMRRILLVANCLGDYVDRLVRRHA